MTKVAIIGGKGHEYPDYLTDIEEINFSTPYGQAGPALYYGKFNGLEVIHLARHGKEQFIPPLHVNYRANLVALKKLECDFIISTCTCGSLQDEICPGDVIILDQFIDMTRQFQTTLENDEKKDTANYFSMAEPFSEDLRNHLIESAIVQGITVHTKGTVLSIDGQRSSSRAESNLYRTWGADVINMTTAPEVILANDLGIPYAAITLCNKYDAWRTGRNSDEEEDIEQIIEEGRNKTLKILSYAFKRIEVPD